MNKGRGKILVEFIKLSLLGPLFIYNPAKTILYCTTDNVKDFIEALKIQEGSLKKRQGYYLLEKSYIFKKFTI